MIINPIKGTSVKIHVPGAPLKKKPEKLAWPRKSEDSPHVDLGVDVVKKRKDIIKLVHKFFKVESISMEELLQEVYTAIIYKNYTRSAHDPRKSSFGHYIYMISNNVCINLVNKKKRYEKEGESLDCPSFLDERKTVLDTVEDVNSRPKDEVSSHIEEVEKRLRMDGKRDLARYITAVKSGASLELIKEALTFGKFAPTNKTIRDRRVELQNVLKTMELT